MIVQCPAYRGDLNFENFQVSQIIRLSLRKKINFDTFKAPKRMLDMGRKTGQLE